MNIVHPGDYSFRGIIREFYFEYLTKDQKFISEGV